MKLRGKFIKGTSLLFISLVLSTQSCKKIIEVDLPINSSTSESVYNDIGTTVSALNAIYITLSNESFLLTGSTGMTIRSGLLSDELKTNSGEYYFNRLTGGEELNMWDRLYRIVIYRVNAAIIGISASSGIQGQAKIALIAEAKFLRAYAYYNLVNYYGDVPLVLGIDFKENSNIPRNAVSKVYDQIISDLLDAQAGLNQNYIAQNLTGISSERIRANKAVATALLARVYLYRQQWLDAERNASIVIADSRYRLLDDLNFVFLKNSDEAIWQLQPNPLLNNGSNPNTPDGRDFLPRNPPSRFYLTEDQINIFENFDKRLLYWTKQGKNNLGETVRVPYKYKIGQSVGQPSQEEYTMVFRLAEQYLIRAEARIKQGNFEGALADLNIVRLRAGLVKYSSSNQTDIMDAILIERQRELFSEGHRWLDLKRVGEINQAMAVAAPKKSSPNVTVTWAPYKALLPIPWPEFKLNPALRGHQNPGYSEE